MPPPPAPRPGQRVASEDDRGRHDEEAPVRAGDGEAEERQHVQAEHGQQVPSTVDHVDDRDRSEGPADDGRPRQHPPEHVEHRLEPVPGAEDRRLGADARIGEHPVCSERVQPVGGAAPDAGSEPDPEPGTFLSVPAGQEGAEHEEDGRLPDAERCDRSDCGPPVPAPLPRERCQAEREERPQLDQEPLVDHVVGWDAAGTEQVGAQRDGEQRPIDQASQHERRDRPDEHGVEGPEEPGGHERPAEEQARLP